MTPNQPQPVPPVDPGNQLLTEQVAQLTTAPVETPRGPRLVLTIRTPSTTLSVFLTGNDALLWGKQIAADASKLNGAGLIVVGNSN